jgi:DNA-binding LacI/PurR family transcriptional regulator
MVATMHDVASRAGVSIKTVSNVINGYQYLRPETRFRVQEAIAALGYHPNLTARGLRSGHTGVISLIIPDLRNAYFAELADEVMRAAEHKGLSVLIELGGTREREISLLESAHGGMTDGILYCAIGLTQSDTEQLRRIQTPIVLLSERLLDDRIDHVVIRNFEATRAATLHLISTGRKRIVAFGADHTGTISPAGLRLEGYLQALAESGIGFDRSLVTEVRDWSRLEGAKAMRSLLDSAVKFDGVMAFSDTIALGAMRVMQEAGIRISADVAIVGFDDIDETRYSLPSLTSVDPGRSEMARVAVDLLQERIANPTGRVLASEYFADFTIVARESSQLPTAGG